MIISVEDVVLRKPELRDVPDLYRYKNDPEVSSLLGGFAQGYSSDDLRAWIEFHRNRADESLWIIADAETDKCLGHVGFYNIDYRVSSAEFAIMLGDSTRWGRGLGRKISKEVIQYGFRWLNFNRIELSALSSNTRAIHVYEGLGFQLEGVRRQAQYKDGQYVDVQLMAILRDELE